MRFQKQEVIKRREAGQPGSFDIAFYGDDQLDDRSTESAKLSRELANQSILLQYDSANFSLNVGGKVYRIDDLDDLPQVYPARKIIIDATTLEFPEILLVLNAYRHYSSQPPECTFIYLEPEEYVKNPQDNRETPTFQLSERFNERLPIPGFNPSLSPTHTAHLVAFLGFEGARALRVLQDDDGHYFKAVTVVFGFPPFQSSWDLHSLMANVDLLTHSNPDVCFVGANDPMGAYLLLDKVKQGLNGAGCNRLAVTPFGTKPNTIGVALYCIENRLMRVIYDYPVRKKGRTKGVHCIHRYVVNL